jgi:hypothetical protein
MEAQWCATSDSALQPIETRTALVKSYLLRLTYSRCDWPTRCAMNVVLCQDTAYTTACTLAAPAGHQSYGLSTSQHSCLQRRQAAYGR